MKYSHTPLIIANWKMNPITKDAAKRLFKEVSKGLTRVSAVDVALAPPFVYLDVLGSLVQKNTKLAAQNVAWEKLGPYTGEVSPHMLKELKVEYIIIGHSERRALGETNDMVNKKILAALKEGFVPVVCVGEKKRDREGHYFGVVEEQVKAACAGISKAKIGKLVIAYEPVWAISSGDGKGKTATAEDAHEMRLFIQKVLTNIYGRNVTQKIKILYGGSVNEKNTDDLLRNGEADGFLIGGASLRSLEFIQMVKIVERYGKE